MIIAGLHAHYSNVEYIENAFKGHHVELIHFVDPGLIKVIQSDPGFDVTKKVQEQLHWIAAVNVDLIIVTCTNYILYIEEPSILGIPIVKIDEPFFDVLKCTNEARIYFTNPHTVDGTMNRFQQFMNEDIASHFQITIIKDTFDLIMSNRKEDYNKAIVNTILEHTPRGLIAFPQLSMATAAEQLKELGFNVITPLDTLKEYLNNKFGTIL